MRQKHMDKSERFEFSNSFLSFRSDPYTKGEVSFFFSSEFLYFYMFLLLIIVVNRFFALILISCNCLYFQSLFLHHWILSDQSLDRSKWLPALHLKVRDDLLYYLWCSPSVLSSDRRNNLDHIYICRLICLVNYQKTLEASMLNSLNSLGVPLDPLGTHRHSLYPLFFKHIIWI